MGNKYDVRGMLEWDCSTEHERYRVTPSHFEFGLGAILMIFWRL